MSYCIDGVKLTVLKFDEIPDNPSALPAEFNVRSVKGMSSWTEGDERAANEQMNTELENAQLELLSAQCAMDRLRLRFSAEDLARNGQAEVLRKAAASAAALHVFYNGIVRQVSDSNPNAPTQTSSWRKRKWWRR
jgi:hypothetical protein